MMRKRPHIPKVISSIILFLIIFAFVILTGSISLAIIETESKYIPFKGKDLKGKAVNIDDYIGKKIILLKFGSIYCSTCVTSLKDVATIRKKIGPENLQVIGVNLDIYGIYRVKRFYKGYERFINYPMIIDEKLKISTPYRVQSLPAHVIIDKEGIVRYVSTGVTEKDFDDLEKVITKLVRGEKDIKRFVKEIPLELYLPQNFSKTVQDSIYVVGKTAYKGVDVTLILNGGGKQVVRSMRNLFYIRTPLSLGSNYIEIQMVGKKGDKIQQGIVLFREPKIGMGIESPFPEYHFHTESNEKPCMECHDLNPPTKDPKGFAVATKFCLGCHKELRGKKYVHGPVTVGGCSPCHDFTSTPKKYKIIAFGQDLCFNCHEEKKEDLIKEFLHGPMSAGICVVCHDPHGSNEKYQLRKYVGDLCVMCHADFKTEMYRPAVHKPFQEGDCTNCHFPHSSDMRNFFVKLPGNDLCLTCHQEAIAGHLHPYGKPPTKELNVKLDKEGNLTCLSCHNPHASDSTQLLPKGGCDYCHST
jgi:predicted CXXCH cytochrome family protein